MSSLFVCCLAGDDSRHVVQLASVHSSLASQCSKHSRGQSHRCLAAHFSLCFNGVGALRGQYVHDPMWHEPGSQRHNIRVPGQQFDPCHHRQHNCRGHVCGYCIFIGLWWSWQKSKQGFCQIWPVSTSNFSSRQSWFLLAASLQHIHKWFKSEVFSMHVAL